jgi:hypothetical protein
LLSKEFGIYHAVSHLLMARVDVVCLDDADEAHVDFHQLEGITSLVSGVGFFQAIIMEDI